MTYHHRNLSTISKVLIAWMFCTSSLVIGQPPTDRTPESMESLQDQYSRLEQQSHQIANKIKQSKSTVESDRNELQVAVRKSFEARQALQRAEVADLAQRLKSMQQSIEMRDKLMEKIIARRVTDLLNPDLKWDVSSASVAEKTTQNSNDSSDPTVESVKQKAQGKWIIESLEEPYGSNSERGHELRIEGDLMMFSNETVDMQWQDLSKRKNSKGPVCNVNFVWYPNDQHLVVSGIVSCDGESLKMCYKFPDEIDSGWRPAHFVPGGSVRLFECRRPLAGEEALTNPSGP